MSKYVLLTDCYNFNNGNYVKNGYNRSKKRNKYIICKYDQLINYINDNKYPIDYIWNVSYTPIIMLETLSYNTYTNQIHVSNRRKIWYDSVLCLMLVKQNIKLFKYVINKNTEICEAALNENSKITGIDKNHQNLTFKNDGSAIKYIKNPSTKMILQAIKCGVDASLLFKHKTLLDYSMWLKLVKNDPKTIIYVPPKHQTEELCLSSIKNYDHALYHIDPKKQTYKICEEAIKLNGQQIFLVDEKFRSPILLMHAIRSSNKAIIYINNPSIELCKEHVRQGHTIWNIKTRKMRNKVRSKMGMPSDFDDCVIS